VAVGARSSRDRSRSLWSLSSYRSESPGANGGSPASDLHYNSSGMPAGDAQRLWFREMTERLRSQWLPVDRATDQRWPRIPAEALR
jgi:hypothetical protein